MTFVPKAERSSRSSRPSAARRSWSGVFGMAWSIPVIEVVIRASCRNLRWASKMVESSLSKPMIIPHQTPMPASWMRWTFSMIVPPLRRFWSFFVSFSDASFGVSIPTKTKRMFAWTISSISSSSSARSSDASVKKVRG